MCGGYDAMPSGGVQPTVKMEHADRAGAQGGSMPMQQHMHGHGPLMTAAMLSMSSTPSLPPMQSQTRVPTMMPTMRPVTGMCYGDVHEEVVELLRLAAMCRPAALDVP